MKYQLSDYDYHLPPELIAKAPLDERTASRMLHIDRNQGQFTHQKFTDLLDFLQPNDLLVFNNTKVIPARIYGKKATGGQIECLLERLLDTQTAQVHLRASKAPKPGTLIHFNSEFSVKVIGRNDAFFVIENQHLNKTLLALFEQFGSMPLPPYIQRAADDNDQTRYQTVFASELGAVAAPTASLHFDQNFLEKITAKGVQQAFLTLHVGAGTFQPVRVEDIRTHSMHGEFISVPNSVCEKIKACKEVGGRVIAVGTTVMRSLETAAATGDLLPFEGETHIFIYPGFQFQCVDTLLTNFHLPQSSLLMLVAAFAGYDLMFAAYEAAITEQYRFFSYGDCMLIS